MTKQTWSAVRSAVSKLSREDLLSLIAEIYRLSKQNHQDELAHIQDAA